jgi:glycosyltransferase involved in cell wall biosynthesis
MKTPSASILIATHNAGRFISATIESALRQTLPDFEVIVVDDGSTDDTLDRIRSFGDSRLRIIQQSNQGAPAALNAGLSAARGNFIGLLDHDDLWLETKLARHVELFEKCPELDATFSWVRLIDESGRDLGGHPAPWRGPISFRQLREGNPMGTTSSLVLRRAALDAIGGFGVNLPSLYDADAMSRIALLRTGNIRSVPEELTLYRKHRGQMSIAWESVHRESEVMIEKFMKLAPEETAAAERRARSNRALYLALLAYRAGCLEPASELACSALLNAPGKMLTKLWQWKVLAACITGRVLPRVVHRRLERLAGFRREER